MNPKVAARVDWITSVRTGDRAPARSQPGTRSPRRHRLGTRGRAAARGDITSRDVSAGIDMALWLIGRIHGWTHPRVIRRKIQYEPAPPYMAHEPLAG